MERRRFLQLGSAALMGALGSTRSAYAAAPTDNRLVFVFLRGALDGLHALAPYADPAYRELRPQLALERDQVNDLNGYFGLHTGLGALMPLWQSGELSFLPATSTRYRSRSHFDAQNLLENGSTTPYGMRDGWLNRAILALNDNDRRLGLSIGPAVPLILQGQASVQSWSDSSLPEADEDFLLRVGRMYQQDPIFADAFHDAQGALQPDIDMNAMGGRNNSARDFAISAQVAADLLAHPQGPRVAVMEMTGWDTHFNQEARLNGLFQQLAEGIILLRDGLARDWSRTAVVVVSEFGRTAAENGSRGTDHGTGGLVMLAGGAVRGRQIGGDWPGLAQAALFEGRDVMPANPMEGLFKTLLIAHLGLPASVVESTVFPASTPLRPLEGLIVGV